MVKSKILRNAPLPGAPTGEPLILVISSQQDTKGGGAIKVEAWTTKSDTTKVVKYSLVYANTRLFDKDNGRILGYDNAHTYPGFKTYHHKHDMGLVYENNTFTTFKALLDQFQSELGVLKQKYGKDY